MESPHTPRFPDNTPDSDRTDDPGATPTWGTPTADTGNGDEFTPDFDPDFDDSPEPEDFTVGAAIHPETVPVLPGATLTLEPDPEPQPEPAPADATPALAPKVRVLTTTVITETPWYRNPRTLLLSTATVAAVLISLILGIRLVTADDPAAAATTPATLPTAIPTPPDTDPNPDPTEPGDTTQEPEPDTPVEPLPTDNTPLTEHAAAVAAYLTANKTADGNWPAPADVTANLKPPLPLGYSIQAYTTPTGDKLCIVAANAATGTQITWLTTTNKPSKDAVCDPDTYPTQVGTYSAAAQGQNQQDPEAKPTPAVTGHPDESQSPGLPGKTPTTAPTSTPPPPPAPNGTKPPKPNPDAA